MTNVDQSLILTLIWEEIRRIVAESIETGHCLLAGPSATAIARAYPNCGLNPAEIAERIVEAAVHAGIAVEMSRPTAMPA